MKKFGIWALALTFLSGVAVTSFAQDSTQKKDSSKTKTKKKKKKTTQ